MCLFVLKKRPIYYLLITLLNVKGCRSDLMYLLTVLRFAQKACLKVFL